MLRSGLSRGRTLGQSVSRWTPSENAARATASTIIPPSAQQPHQQQQTRSNFQVHLKRTLDRKTGKVKYQDWSYVALGIREPQLANGQTLLNRHLRAREHIKPTERKRRINAKKIYDRDRKRVDDLSNYIKFIQEYDTSAPSSRK